VSVFDQYARYYDLLYRDKNYQAETDYVASAIQRFAPKAKRILEFGSGTGIHGRLLAQKNYAVIGIERSLEMVARANQNTIDPAPGTFASQQGDIRDAVADGSFDAVISLFHVISYQTSNADALAVFQNAFKHLKSGGIFLFDVWYSPAVWTQRPVVRVKRMEDDHIRLERIAEPIIRPNENVVEVQYTVYITDKSTGSITKLDEIHPMRHFSIPELDLFAEQTGFTVLHREEFLTSKHPSEDTWGVCFVWSKK
jgi:SAM-dependent methyltransferase